MPEVDAVSLVDLRNLALAAVVGFLIGFEREWTHVAEAREHTFAGARTFALVGFIGGLVGFLTSDWSFIAVAFAAVAALTIVAYWADAREAPGLGGTTEMAIFATFLLGLAATRGHLLVAVIGGVSVAILLSLKDTVKRIAASLSEAEIHAALRFLAISIIILPILPDQGYGPYEALNPREIWLMVVFISGLSFLGYWLVKALGSEQGVFVTGIVGGLASSTATTLSLSKFARDGKSEASAVAAGVIAANVVMLIRVGFLLAAVARPALAAIWPVLAAGAVVGTAAALYFWRAAGKSKTSAAALEVDNPMEVKPALIFAGLLAIIAVASRFGADQFGEGALFVVGLVSGLADVDAMTLTAGRQAASGAIGALVAGGAIMAAVASNIVVKAAMSWSIGGRSVGLIVAGVFAAIIATGAAVYLFLNAA